MTGNEKLKAAREQFRALGMNPNIGAPPIVRVFWLVGIPVPPLVFLRFTTIALITGAFFAVFWGFFMWVFFWSGPGTPRWVAFGVPALAGVAFGLYNAWRMRAVAQKLHLPLWAQYNGLPLAARPGATQSQANFAVGSGAKYQSKFTRIAPCPHCSSPITLGIFLFLPRPFVGPRITCPHCHKRCTLRLWLRFAAWLAGFAICMAISMLFITLMVIMNYDNSVLMYIVVITSVLAFLAVDIFICFKYGVLVESRI